MSRLKDRQPIRGAFPKHTDSTLQPVSLSLGCWLPEGAGPPTLPAGAQGSPSEGNSGQLWPWRDFIHHPKDNLVVGGYLYSVGGSLLCPFSSKKTRHVSRYGDSFSYWLGRGTPKGLLRLA